MRKMTGQEFDQLVGFFDSMVQTSWLSGIHGELKGISGSWSNLSILDVGCGTGRLLMRGAEEARQLTGVDLSEAMIQSAQQVMKPYISKTNLSVGDACELPLQDDQFDLSLATCVLFLLPEPEVAMQEMLRVTKKAGRIITLNPSVYLTEEVAEELCRVSDMSEFEKTTLKQWSKVSQRRHRYDEQQLSDIWLKLGASSVENQFVYHKIGILTVVNV
ncbi:class I SAM-dependent methyltransferase [Bacillus solimangrovi]|uniref:Ubiquinone biosynthesis methyltransferase UbiE n=1 Tax=Bacillus solimangrovi TaxID=1305675 RepID=A0A1E5LAU0_9BACI|nr:class I SAM-dependent methyltransferase [Bacillus solimangrovi]OEH91204.1 ubiquinone biosynthesis methyltransferase UbiE [Bacillus solimangrovi]